MPADDSPRYWLFKSEADCFSIDDLAAAPRKTTFWDGVRNYQARNFLRDDVRVGDRVFLYHSNSEPLAIVGTMQVVRAAYPDHTAFDPAEQHFDSKSCKEAPTWYMVDVRLAQKFPVPVTRQALLADARLQGMMVLQRGSRLSILPVTLHEWRVVHELAGVADK